MRDTGRGELTREIWGFLLRGTKRGSRPGFPKGGLRSRARRSRASLRPKEYYFPMVKAERERTQETPCRQWGEGEESMVDCLKRLGTRMFGQDASLPSQGHPAFG